MNMRKKLLGTVGAFALAMSMATGVVGAQESTTASAGISVTVVCGTANVGPSSVSMVAGGNTNFVDFDPSGEATSSRMSDKALTVRMDIDECQTGAWHVDASITDFTSGDDTISGTQFQLPIDEDSASLNAYDAANNPVSGVVAPSALTVTFGENGSSVSPHASNQAIASTSGGSTGTMFMDFTGELVDLAADTPPGTYTAEFTVTWTPGAP